MEASLHSEAGLGLTHYVNVFVIVCFNSKVPERPHGKCGLMYLVPEEDSELHCHSVQQTMNTITTC